MSKQYNLIHASSSADDAKREINILFDIDELFHYRSVLETVVYAEEELRMLQE